MNGLVSELRVVFNLHSTKNSLRMGEEHEGHVGLTPQIHLKRLPFHLLSHCEFPSRIHVNKGFYSCRMLGSAVLEDQAQQM